MNKTGAQCNDKRRRWTRGFLNMHVFAGGEFVKNRLEIWISIEKTTLHAFVANGRGLRTLLLPNAEKKNSKRANAPPKQQQPKNCLCEWSELKRFFSNVVFVLACVSMRRSWNIVWFPLLVSFGDPLVVCTFFFFLFFISSLASYSVVCAFFAFRRHGLLSSSIGAMSECSSGCVSVYFSSLLLTSSHSQNFEKMNFKK